MPSVSDLNRWGVPADALKAKRPLHYSVRVARRPEGCDICRGPALLSLFQPMGSPYRSGSVVPGSAVPSTRGEGAGLPGSRWAPERGWIASRYRLRGVEAGLLCWSGGQQGRTPVVRGAPRGALNHPGVVLDTLSELPTCGVLETANRWAAHPTTGDHGRGRCLPVFPSCATRELRCPDGTVQTSILPRGSSAKVGPVVPRFRCALLSLSCQRGAPPCPSLRTKGPPAVALR